MYVVYVQPPAKAKEVKKDACQQVWSPVNESSQDSGQITSTDIYCHHSIRKCVTCTLNSDTLLTECVFCSYRSRQR